ncbi:MAG: hypothetical protein JW734_03825 [Candidatus Omnitrophica bacterium]|nr:hypothetical protein [Candidatus Omnitrophota bacterium]
MSIVVIRNTLRKLFSQHLESLKDFQFSFRNHLFWIFVLVLFVILTRFWKAKKAFSFCFVTVALLLLTTKAEELLGAWLTNSGETFDPLLIRAVSAFLIFIIFFYYSIIREE